MPLKGTQLVHQTQDWLECHVFSFPACAAFSSLYQGWYWPDTCNKQRHIPLRLVIQKCANRTAIGIYIVPVDLRLWWWWGWWWCTYL